MFFLEDKIKARLDEMEPLRYRDGVKIPEFRFLEDEKGEIGTFPPNDEEAWSIIETGSRWEGRDKYAWLSCEVDIPKCWTGKKLVGRFDFGKTDEGTNSGFESLLFLHGQPYQGVDANHKEVFLPVQEAGNKLRLDFRLWSGLEGGGPKTVQAHRLKMAEISWLDESADDYYYTVKAALETVLVLPAVQPERHQLLKAIDRSLREVEWQNRESEDFYRSIDAALTILKEELGRIEKHSRITVTCVGHTHIDVAWLWRLKHTREKIARSFSTVLRLMEQYPDYVFLQTQPQLYAYIKEDYPEIYARIRERVAEGRWEAAGGMWLEADCNIPSGESLVRQVLFGTRFLEDEFGKACTYLWLPDVFGYSWALPQILKKSGIDRFMTTKISWNQFNRIPHDTFTWRGMDGSEIMAHFITTPEPGHGKDSWMYTYNGRLTAYEAYHIWDNYRDKEINEELLLSYGYGDGGGGVNREMLEMRRRLDEMPGLPHVKTGTAGDYFERLKETIDETTQYVHTWDGELYLEYHRGTYTSQANVKRMNRKLELGYREGEWLSAFASLLEGNWGKYAQQQINDGWRIILRNQFHDIIPGSSIQEVYEDAAAEYGEAQALISDVRSEALRLMTDADANSYTVFNGSTWEREDLLEIESPAHGSGVWIDQEGKELAAHKGQEGWSVLVKVPAMGYTQIRFIPKPAEGSQTTCFAFTESGLETPFYKMAWNEQGQLTNIWDKELRRNVLKKDGRGNVLRVFEDKPLAFDAWDIDIFYKEKMKEVTALESAELLESGPLYAIVRFRWTYNRSSLVQDMKVYSQNRRIDFVTNVDWQEQSQLLKAAFEVDVRSTEATYDIQYGNVKRPTHWNTSWDLARFEVVGHQWADLSERGFGVSLLNDCKYGYDIKDNVLSLSLIKSANFPDPEQDIGLHQFTYSLLPHKGDWYEGGTVAAAWNLNNPLTSHPGTASHTPKSLFKLSADGVMIDAVKKAEDEDMVIIRLHDYSGSRSEMTIESDLDIVSWQECNLMEKPIGELNLGPAIATAFTPYEIKTFAVVFKERNDS
ncbi:alpha-mannosidase [Bacillus sp. FJAT-26390]|uniref:alpha-mannosidase n=1 Tax=Bacillus sp. FJAT-26390 TaxID=1743142 RepID=UPI000807A960|nr:alpha-mannosidase [Bacillus sp. FJAT-26390]OBZ09490.1 alpha-mannosidase [Bacillus sp. FJAT-26390]